MVNAMCVLWRGPLALTRYLVWAQARSPEACMYDDTNKDAAVMHKRPTLVEAPGGFVPMPTSLKQVGSAYHPHPPYAGPVPDSAALGPTT